MQDFIVNDEQHFVTYDKDSKYILLRSENIDGLTDIIEGRDLGSKAIAGWAYDFGKGRVVFTAVGHTLHAMWQPEYFKVQKNAVRWLLKRNSQSSADSPPHSTLKRGQIAYINRIDVCFSSRAAHGRLLHRLASRSVTRKLSFPGKYCAARSRF